MKLLLIILLATLLLPSATLAQEKRVQRRTVLEETQKRTEELRLKRENLTNERTAAESTRSNRSRAKSRLEEKRQSLKNKITDKRKEISQERKAKIQEIFERMTTFLVAAIAREEKLIERIQSRLDKLSQAGKDVAGVQQSLEQAKAKLEQAASDASSLEGIGGDVLATENPSSTFRTAKEMVQSVKRELQEVHKMLTSIIGDIKGLRVGETKNETQQ